jgi:hypothetical protein
MPPNPILIGKRSADHDDTLGEERQQKRPTKEVSQVTLAVEPLSYPAAAASAQHEQPAAPMAQHEHDLYANPNIKEDW